MELLDRYPKGKYFNYSPIFESLKNKEVKYKIEGYIEEVEEVKIEKFNVSGKRYDVKDNIKIITKDNEVAILSLNLKDDTFLNIENNGVLFLVLEGDIENALVYLRGNGKFYVDSKIIASNYAIKIVGGYGSYRVNIDATKDTRVIGRVYSPEEKSEIELVANIEHNHSTFSELDFRGVSKGYVSLRARSALNKEGSGSRIKIKLINFNRGSVLPYLEVNTGEVTEAYHSGSVEYITDEIVDYLRHRGLDSKDIEKIVVQEFLGF